MGNMKDLFGKDGERTYKLPEKVKALNKALKDIGIKEQFVFRPKNHEAFLPAGFELRIPKDFLIILNTKGNLSYYCNTQQ